METVDEALSNRVDAAIQAHKRAVLSTSGPTTAIGELVTRLEGLELTLRAADHDAQILRQIGVDVIRDGFERQQRLLGGRQEDHEHAPGPSHLCELVHPRSIGAARPW